MGTRGEPSLRPGRTIFGHAIVDGEEIGTLPRCLRLMAAAVRVLESEEMAQPEAVGVPLGDGHGMESLVTRLAPLFARDRSLVRWVALKGALLFLDTSFLSDIEWRTAMLSMGLEHAKSPYTGEDEIQVLERPGPISPVVISQILGLHASIMMGLAEFERISKASLDEVNQNPIWNINDPMAFDYIAWAAVAMLRTGAARRVFEIPEPGALESAGWYAEPVFAKCERYWDGSDWTALVRWHDRRQWIEGTSGLTR
jgi:hypothetical protein